MGIGIFQTNVFEIRFAKILIASTLLFTGISARSQKVFDFNPACQKAYHELFILKLDKGQELLNREKKENPDNLIPYFLENYIDFFELFFNEDPAAFKNLKGNFARRIEMMDEGPDASAFKLLTKSVINLQAAAVQIKFGNTWEAGWAFRRSLLQSAENIRKYPLFSPSYLYNGVLQTAAGTIPDNYKWLTSLLGVKGTVQAGMKTINEFINKKDEFATLFRDEAIFYYLYLKFYVENDKDGVFNFISTHDLDLVNNQMFTYLGANLHLNNQQSARAELILNARNRSKEYMETPVWDLEMGYVKISQLDSQTASHFTRFIDNFKGNFYLKDALQKLSWFHYLNGDMEQAKLYRSRILKAGSQNTESDKQAHKEALLSTWPNKLLLKVRLLNDGGYHREALRLLHGKTINDFKDTKDQLEFCYRVARLYDDLGNTTDAISFYKQTITLGEKRTEYFAARAALQLAYIYEEQDQCEQALIWFNRCISMKNHDFKDSLDQRAKAGQKRCSV